MPQIHKSPGDSQCIAKGVPHRQSVVTCDRQSAEGDRPRSGSCSPESCGHATQRRLVTAEAISRPVLSLGPSHANEISQLELEGGR